MPSEAHVQNLIHRLEEGKWAKWVRLSALIAICIAAMIAFIFDPMFWGLFRGLSHPKAMEQAQIAREIASGNGFTTRVIRPVAMAQITKLFQEQGDTPEARAEIAAKLKYDTYHAPLWPATLAPFLKLLESKWVMTGKTMTYHLDKMIIAVSIVLFYASVLVNFFTIRRLFDAQLAILVSGLLLLCNVFWSFAVSGLPQMQMLFFFSLAVYTLLRAFEAREAKASPLRWLLATAFFFGLLALVHPITLWAFGGALLISLIYFRPRIMTGLAMVAIVFVMITPWMVRNYRICGNPLGVAGYSMLYQVRGTEGSIMRSMETDSLKASPQHFRPKVQNGIHDQFSNLYESLGGILVAPLFFIALMHLFRKPETRAMKWALFTMWLSALFGMALAGSDDGSSPVAANNIHLLFIPLFTAYGLGFVLVLWNRREVKIPYLRTVFIGMIYVVSALPLFNFFTATTKIPFWWPPYAPPSIARLHDWTEDKEVIASDMPWAVAWYAGRTSIWIPGRLKDFIELHDYARLQQPIAGLFLTPITGNAGFMSELLKGEYKDWAPLVLRSNNVSGFPFNKILPMEIRGECVFFSDRVRWLHDAEQEALMPEEAPEGKAEEKDKEKEEKEK